MSTIDDLFIPQMKGLGSIQFPVAITQNEEKLTKKLSKDLLERGIEPVKKSELSSLGQHACGFQQLTL